METRLKNRKERIPLNYLSEDIHGLEADLIFDKSSTNRSIVKHREKTLKLKTSHQKR